MTLPVSRDQTFVDGVSQVPSVTLNRIQDVIVALAAITALGNGKDGPAVADGAGAIPGASRSGSVYTLTRDVFYTDLTLSPGVEVKRNGFRPLCKGTCTVPATAKITSNGSNGQYYTLIGAGAPAGSVRGGGDGGNGSDYLDAGGSAATDLDGSNGGSGGAGGAGNGVIANPGKAGGVATPPDAEQGGDGTLWTLQTGFIVGLNSGTPEVFALRGGCGGGGGSGDSDGGSNHMYGGAGGGGAGVGILMCAKLVLDGTIECDGGVGGDTHVQAGTVTTLGGGGGGGGGGGDNLVGYFERTGSGSITSTGGAGGNGSIIGNHGAAGANGRVLEVDMSA